jgi:hypothetical protein
VLIEAGYDPRVNLVYRSDYDQCAGIETSDIETLTREADVIFFISREDEPACVGNAYERLKPVSKAEVVFVGPKNFGLI